MRPIYLLVATTLLTACLTTYEGDENSPYYPVPPGSRITLTQTLPIAADQVGVFIQDGRVVPQQEIRQYYPHCKFEVYTRRDVARTVAPDEFLVSRTVQEYAHSTARDSAQKLRVATATGAPIALFIGDDDVDVMVTFATRMYLQSEKQPDVFRLTCAQWGYLPSDRHVTIAEMRRVLGSLLILQLPTPSRAAT